MDLSERQEKIVAFVREFSEDRGYPPTIREIGAAVNISSTSVVNYNLNKLESAGLLERDRTISRGVRLTTPFADRAVDRIPLLGTIVAGVPIPVPGSDFALMGDETVDLARGMLGDVRSLYALRVQGDSMVDALVNDGDIVIMRHQPNVENGEMAAVWLEDREETTLKHFYREGTRVRLQPANPLMGPIYVNDPRHVRVQGKVVMVIRHLDQPA